MNGETNRDAWRDSVETWLKGDERNDVFDGYLDWYRAPVMADTDDWTRDFFVLPAVGSDVLHKHAGFVDGDSPVSVDDTTWHELSTLIGEAFSTYAATKH